MSIVKAAQYLATVSLDQDFNSELCNVVSSFFSIDAVAVARKNSAGGMVFQECWMDNLCFSKSLKQQTVLDCVQDVWETGLFKEEILSGPPDMTLFFLPVEAKKKVAAVLIIGHYEFDRAHVKKVLNEYLAVAGLAGTVLTRIDYEQETIIRKSDEKFRLLFENSRDPILLLGDSGSIVECNQAAVRILGAAAKDRVLGRRIADFAPEYQPDWQRSADKEQQLNEKILKEGAAQHEWVILRPDGSTVIVDANVTTIEMGGSNKQLLNWRDITERKMFEEKLQYLNVALERKMRELQEINATLEEEIDEKLKAQEELRKSRDELLTGEKQLKLYAAQLTAANEELASTNSELKSFAYIIAHDFRTPMVNLKGFSKELDNALADLREILNNPAVQAPDGLRMRINNLLDADVPDSLTFIQSAVDRLSRMINALLQLSRIGRRELTFKEVDMNSLVSTVLASYRKVIEERSVQVRQGKLPGVITDYVAMEQIIGNLVDNALKYLDPKRPGRIAISCIERDDEYLFSIADNGRGVADPDLEKIFELFRRAGRQDVPGEGMGLAHVRTLLRQLGGKVWCESQTGVGTTMYFTLPTRLAE